MRTLIIVSLVTMLVSASGGCATMMVRRPGTSCAVTSRDKQGVYLASRFDIRMVVVFVTGHSPFGEVSGRPFVRRSLDGRLVTERSILNDLMCLSMGFVIGPVVWLVDLPISIVTDTVFLPYDIENLDKQDKAESDQSRMVATTRHE